MANPEKHRLAVEEITYLGYCRGGGLLKPVVNKVQVLTAYPISPDEEASEVFSQPGRILLEVYPWFHLNCSTLLL